MTILVTGVAGFIGFHTAMALLGRGDEVVGVDNLNAYYDPALKRARLGELSKTFSKAFHFIEGDIADPDVLSRAAGSGFGQGACQGSGRGPVRAIIHLAAQAGVRYSLENPATYVRSNLVGHANVLEFARHADGLDHLVYASSSSVYGGNEKQPFAETDRVDNPVSLYAATKRADELMSHTYVHLFGLPQTGLRFFTVYGPWGRPDMAAWLFVEAIFEGRPIKIYNEGRMARDFTYIDDIVAGVLAALDNPPPRPDRLPDASVSAHRIYNLGNNAPVRLMDMIAQIEKAAGREAVKEFHPMQPGDVLETYADIACARKDLGFTPSTSLADGLERFVAWYRRYRGV